jgi:dihydropteroate synthase
MWPEPIRCRRATLDGSRTYVMGVVNLTPDSFSDGGQHLDPEAAVARARALIAEGADVIDLGAESTRPGAEPVDAGTEWSRLGPVLRALADAPVPISVDTYKAEVAARAIEAGAEVINDISGGRLDPALLPLCAARGAVVVLSHLRGAPRTMMESIHFDDVFAEVAAELESALGRARDLGVRRLIADPGLGFGKRAEHNLTLLARAGELERRLRVPVLVGPSRKAFLGALTGQPVAGRGPATLAAAVAAALSGASMVRVHEVAAARQALAVADAVRAAVPAQGQA